jgi:hypothetical protein
VVLLVVLLMMTGGSALVLAYHLDSSNPRVQSAQESGQALSAAREALIAFAVNYADNYGHNTRGGTGRLPCPAAARFSSPDWRCGEVNLGFLPTLWERDGKILDIDYVERFLDRDLWYSVAPDFRFNPSFNPLSAISVSRFLSVDHIEDVVAVIIDPGEPLPWQRSERPGNDVSAYLEGENADGDLHFSVQTGGNDRLLWITRDQLMPLIERRVLGDVRDWLVEYKQRYGRYPYASALGDDTNTCVNGLTRGMLSMVAGDCVGKSFGQFVSESVPKGRMINQTWFNTNQWQQQILYHVASDCAGDQALSACDGFGDDPLPLRIDSQPLEVMLITAGVPIESTARGAMQNRQSSSALIEYLDTPTLLAAIDEYPFVRIGAGSNDQMLFIAQPPL